MLRPVVERQKKTHAVVHPHPVVNRVLQNRGVSAPDEIEYSLGKLLDYRTMKGIDIAARLIEDAIMMNHQIVILGDFDCDGATSTTIMTEGLLSLGAKKVHFMVPHRMKHGYGLTPKVVEEFKNKDPRLLITVDNGIAAFDGVDAVRKELPDCKILVTDHHLESDRGQPDADCIVDPCQAGCDFPSKSIAGCGVAFYTIMAARARMDSNNSFSKLGINKPSLAPLLDVLALGTVADVVPLDMNNRNIVDAGLRMINRGLVRPGLRAVLEKKKKTIGKIEASDFGFAAGPCLNAAGRLEDMTLGIKCLLAKDEHEARSLAHNLVDLNEKRKSIEKDMKDQAEFEIETSQAEFGHVVYNPDWHEGVVGIVASRVKDATNRPAICMTNTEGANEVLSRIREKEALGASEAEIKDLYDELDDSYIKGSARSVEGIHVKHLLDRIAKKHDEIFVGYGGHSMAAGLTIVKKHLGKFQKVFDEFVKEEMTEEILEGKLEVDIKEIGAEHLTLDNARLFKSVTPWGQKFEEPTFSGTFDVVSKKPVGNGDHLKLVLRKDGVNFDAIAFNVVKNGVDPVGDIVEVVFKMSINEFRGKVSMQLMVDFIQTTNKTEEVSEDEFWTAEAV